MTTDAQYIIIVMTVIAAIAYIVHRIRQTFSEAQSGCYGCKGCALKEQMMKRNGKKRGKSNKFECFEKKHGKTFGG